jgi:hypothetical protein
MDPEQNTKAWPIEHSHIERRGDGGLKESGNQREICSYDHERWRLGARHDAYRGSEHLRYQAIY